MLRPASRRRCSSDLCSRQCAAVRSSGRRRSVSGALRARGQTRCLCGSPNVVALHDVGFHDGKPYFVTELLHGETLRERLAKGPIPLAKALDGKLEVRIPQK